MASNFYLSESVDIQAIKLYLCLNLIIKQSIYFKGLRSAERYLSQIAQKEKIKALYGTNLDACQYGR